MAPERICGELQVEREQIVNANKVDTWSVGVLIYVLIYGKVPFTGETYSQLVKHIKKGSLRDQGNVAGGLKSLVELMKKLLIVDVQERFDAL